MSGAYPYQKPWPSTPLNGRNTIEDVIDTINNMSEMLKPQSDVFYENNDTLTVDYAVPASLNAIAAGPLKVSAGVTLTVTSGSTITIV